MSGASPRPLLVNRCTTPSLAVDLRSRFTALSASSCGRLSRLVRAASRHEQQLTCLEADRSYVFFQEVGYHGLVGMLVQALFSSGRPDSTRSKTTSMLFRQQRRLTGSADSAPVDRHRMECGAKESLANQKARMRLIVPRLVNLGPPKNLPRPLVLAALGL